MTGSVGKTGTKEMIYNVLNEKFSTFKTEKNHNNDIGLSLTINKNKKRAQNSSSGNGD